MERNFNITRLGVCVPSDVDLSKIRPKLTVTHKGFNKRIIKRYSWKIDRASQKMYLARAAGISLLKIYVPRATFTNLIGAGETVDHATHNVVLTAMQQAVYDYLMHNIYTEAAQRCASSTSIIDMPAGTGKTYLVTPMVATFAKKTLVVVTDETLLKQWYKHFTDTMPGCHIGLQYSKKKIDGDIVIGCIGSLLGDTITYKPLGSSTTLQVPSTTWFRRFGFTIFDEVHTYCSPVRSDIFKKACSTLTLGMSATTEDRLDNMDAISHHYVGTPIRVMDLPEVKAALMINPGVKFTMNAKIVEYHGPPEYTLPLTSDDGSSISAPRMITQFAKDPYRTMVVLREIIRLYNMDHCVFVFMDRRELVNEFVKLMKVYLAEMKPEVKRDIDNLVIAPDTPDDTVVGVQGGVDELTRNAARDTSRICCLTYQCGSVGLSYPRYTAMVLATPRRNGFKQIINRIFRLGSKPNVVREAVFIRDYKTALKDQVSGFKKVIKDEKNCTPTKETVEWQTVKKFDEIVATNPELKIDQVERKIDSMTL